MQTELALIMTNTEVTILTASVRPAFLGRWYTQGLEAIHPHRFFNYLEEQLVALGLAHNLVKINSWQQTDSTTILTVTINEPEEDSQTPILDDIVKSFDGVGE